MKKTVKCQSCGHEREVDACETCKGTGSKMYTGKTFRDYIYEHCTDCDGTGIKNGRVIVMS